MGDTSDDFFRFLDLVKPEAHSILGLSNREANSFLSLLKLVLALFMSLATQRELILVLRGHVNLEVGGKVHLKSINVFSLLLHFYFIKGLPGGALMDPTVATGARTSAASHSIHGVCEAADMALMAG